MEGDHYDCGIVGTKRAGGRIDLHSLPHDVAAPHLPRHIRLAVVTILTSSIVPILVALLPGAVVWWRSRALTRRLDDPTLPERLLAARAGNGAALGFSFAVLVIAFSSTVAWSVPLLFVARVAAAYPARRILFQETWSLGAYLSFFLRLIAAGYGFWMLLSFAPVLAQLAPPRYVWAADLAIVALLVVWNVRYADVMRGLMRATAIDDPALTARFERLVAASGIEMPRFERVVLHGGMFVNAVALPSLRRSSVIFTDTLISRFDADEVTAIAAHEVAHLEHYNPRRLRRTAMLNYAMIAGAGAAPIVGALLPAAGGIVPYVWPAIVFVLLLGRTHQRQQQETASDLRAVALTGDGEALVRALTRVHTMARVPRRWAANVERQATHPSLARRIKAIREAANCPPAALGDAAAFTSADGAASVVFNADRIEWNETSAARFAIEYAHLNELRVDVRRPAAARLVAVDRAGRRWELPLAAADLARAQAVLDIVDGRTADLAAPPLSPRAARMLAFGIAAFASTVGHFAAAIVAFIAAARMAAPLSAAAACAALAAAGLTLRDGAWGSDDASMPVAALVLALVGAALLFVAYANRRESAPAPTRAAGAALAACTLLSWLGFFSSGFDAVRLHHAARALPAAAVFSMACAGFLAFDRRRRARAVAVGAVLAALLITVVGSEAFLEAFSSDPFITAAPPFSVRTASPRRLAEFPVPSRASGIHLSPRGRSIAVATENEDEETTYHVGRAGGRLTPFDADDVVFLDDDRALLLALGASKGAIVREIAIGDATAAVAERRIDDVIDARLSFDAASRTWTLLGHTRERHIVRVAGRGVDGAVQEQRWTLPGDLTARTSTIASSERAALVMDTRYASHLLPSVMLWQMTPLVGMPPTESAVWSVGAQGATERAHTRLDLRCVSGGASGTTSLCAAFDGVHTRLSRLEAGGRVVPLGQLAGRVYLYDASSAPDWTAAWWRRGAVLLRLSTREAFEIGDATSGPARALTVADAVVGALIFGNGGTTVRVYARP